MDRYIVKPADTAYAAGLWYVMGRTAEGFPDPAAYEWCATRGTRDAAEALAQMLNDWATE